MALVQSTLIEDVATYSPNERMTLVIQLLIGLAALITVVTIWFVWMTRPSRQAQRSTNSVSLSDTAGATTAHGGTLPGAAPVTDTATLPPPPATKLPTLPDFQPGDASHHTAPVPVVKTVD